jgi:hypothetical protein
MKYSVFAAVVAAFASSVSAADAVKGAAEGFAKGMYALLRYKRKLTPIQV